MHSSRMRTDPALHVFPGGGVYLPEEGGTCQRGGVPARGGTCQRGVYMPGVYLLEGGCTCQGGVYLPEGGVPAWGVYLPEGGVPARGGRGCTCQGWGVPARGVYLPEGVYLTGWYSSMNRMTDRCKNITLAKTSFQPVICHSASRALDVQKTRRITTESQQCYLQLLLLIITRMHTVLYIKSVQMCREMIHDIIRH